MQMRPMVTDRVALSVGLSVGLSLFCIRWNTDPHTKMGTFLRNFVNFRLLLRSAIAAVAELLFTINHGAGG